MERFKFLKNGKHVPLKEINKRVARMMNLDSNADCLHPETNIIIQAGIDATRMANLSEGKMKFRRALTIRISRFADHRVLSDADHPLNSVDMKVREKYAQTLGEVAIKFLCDNYDFQCEIPPAAKYIVRTA